MSINGQREMKCGVCTVEDSPAVRKNEVLTYAMNLENACSERGQVKSKILGDAQHRQIPRDRQ